MLLAAGFFAAYFVAPANVGFGQSAILQFETELTSLDLMGGPFPIPLASDPGNLLGDSINGFGFVDSEVLISLSSQRSTNPGPASLGTACAFEGGPAAAGGGAGGDGGGCGGGADPQPIDPMELDGQPFFVDSFFDVFFDITVTDVDSRPGRDFAGQPDMASVTLTDNGPANMSTFYTRIFDQAAPNFGLIPPPEADPYIGHFDIEIPLGGDINGNGENDKIKFTLAAHSVGGQNRTFIILPDGTVVDNFDSAAFLEGAIIDESSDPPFTIGFLDPDTGLPDPTVFGGPTTASSKLRNGVFPEPASLGLLVIGALLWAAARRRF